MLRIVLGFVAGWVIGSAVPLFLGAPDLLVQYAAATAIAGAVTGFVATLESVHATVVTGIATSGVMWGILKWQNHDGGPYVAIGAAAGLIIAAVLLLPRRTTDDASSPSQTSLPTDPTGPC
jgi:hypothetical protein